MWTILPYIDGLSIALQRSWKNLNGTGNLNLVIVGESTKPGPTHLKFKSFGCDFNEVEARPKAAGLTRIRCGTVTAISE